MGGNRISKVTRFSILGRGRWGQVPCKSQNLVISPRPGKIPLIRLPPPNFFFLQQRLISRTLNNIFHVSFIFICSHGSCTIFVLISCSLYTQVMLILMLIDVQYSQKAVFRFGTGSNSQNHSSSGYHYPVKKSLPLSRNPPVTT